MTTQIASDICIHLPIGPYEKAVIEANRKLAELNIKHLLKGGGKWVQREQQREQQRKVKA